MHGFVKHYLEKIYTFFVFMQQLQNSHAFVQKHINAPVQPCAFIYHLYSVRA